MVIGELVARGYAWRDGILGAADVGANHQRDRWWCIAANADGLRQLQPQGSISDKWGRTHYSDQAQDDATGKGFNTGIPTWFEIEPDLDRLVYGVADDMVPGAIKALGNAQVPLQAALAWKILGGP